ncbi:cell division protein ZapE [Pseudomonas syringae]|uniref:AFG1-like ATPase n=1 Tax=Pseudomonas cerasi TaxID=1583341 RepID=A0A193SNG4_9PSED|nr:MULTISPECIES: cell division protein ZapE [Pseudomonas]RVU50409.1 cell division protein ZapE [Pseudomonas syringae pv. syringae]PBP60947.1 cell division protein ZapE [Pseudomonas syringae]TFZ38929.1 cell division protein ZapE [Pseudomonas syringae]CZT28393.1 AFG1-like ATPase [Pseudomonas cerasi]SOS18637.1 AFG1-like ATPase [Pseudomonas cerasi]
MDAVSPLQAYERAVQRGFQPDQAQLQAARQLQVCYEGLADARGRARGVYLWGPVGRGKTWLMDRFFESLSVPARRQHFHHFMRWVHKRMFELMGTSQPLTVVARELARDVRVMCFDELFVTDIGDAVILGGLLQVMFEEGVVLVCTSNQPPEQLYSHGHNRERFLPAVAAILKYMDVVAVDGGEDHRLHPGQLHQRYWIAEAGRPSALQGIFEALSADQPVHDSQVMLGYRSINVVQHSDTAVWCRYRDLCEQPLAAMDFIALCDRFSVILLSEVPLLGAAQREAKIARGTEDGVEQVSAGDRELPQLSPNDDGVRRFIALVDECYDRRIPLYVEAPVPMDELYTEGYLSFAFRRTLSRLQEMQLERFTES